MLHVVWCAVNRVARDGKWLGPDQRIAAREAVKAVTSHTAWQYFEEEWNGSLEPGKLADLVILSDNSLKVNPTKIKDIRVLKTIKEDRTVYRVE